MMIFKTIIYKKMQQKNKDFKENLRPEFFTNAEIEIQK